MATELEAKNGMEDFEVISRQRIEFALDGKIEVSWQGSHTIHMDRALLSIITEQDYISEILLVAEFDPFSAMQLVSSFAPMQGVADGVLTYAFVMKPEVREKYQAEFQDAAFIDEWLKIGDGAILHLENYSCIGRGELDEA